jgi:hypothetical protein
MRFTARPRVGGRRAVGRWCRDGPRRDRPRKGSRPRPPPEGEGGDEIGFSMTGRPLLRWVCGWGEGVVGGHCRFCVTDRSFEGGGELEIVERFLDDDEGLVIP